MSPAPKYLLVLAVDDIPALIEPRMLPELTVGSQSPASANAVIGTRLTNRQRAKSNAIVLFFMCVPLS